MRNKRLWICEKIHDRKIKCHTCMCVLCEMPNWQTGNDR